MLTSKHVQEALARLGYYDGKIDGDLQSGGFRDDLRRFQADHGLVADGWYGKKSDAVLQGMVNRLAKAPAAAISLRRWQLTYYYVGSVAAHSGPKVTMHLVDGNGSSSRSHHVMVPASAFVEAALNGTTKLADGRLANVAQPPYGTCDSLEFQPVYDLAKRNGWLPDKPGYAGIVVKDGKAVQSRNFAIRSGGPKGWPVIAKGIECDPFRTLAADNGRLPKHDPAFRARGGVVPAGTRVFILEMMGVALPDGTTHDGWFTVNDTGGGIYGAHFDVFTGSQQLARKVKIPGRAHIWFDGIEERIPINYSYGL